MDEFTRAYIDCALWSSTDDNDEPMDASYTSLDLCPATMQEMVNDCETFQRDNESDINGRDSLAGHDFWLTRNRHGAGFWDGDWPKDAGNRLTDAAHAYGDYTLYVGDDGMIYGSGG